MSLKPVVHPFNQTIPVRDLKGYLGGKGAGLNQMYQMGVPVPPGFTIPTIFCNSYQKKKKLTIRMEREIQGGLDWMGQELSRGFTDYDEIPMLLSVRSGSPISMPGMMDTILNLGMNNEALTALSDNITRMFALDSYRRLIALYSSVIHGDSANPLIHQYNKAYEVLFKNASMDDKEKALELMLPKLIALSNIPTDPMEQLQEAILAVFKSWNTERAFKYREIEGINHDLGTAVNIQAMVYGNLNDNSGTGVLFTLNPNNGDPEPYGDFLPMAQGEDVVSGAFNTLSISQLKGWNENIYTELMNISQALQLKYRDMLDIEFTIEDGRLFILQSRVGKRTPIANTKINAWLLNMGIITASEMVERQSNIVAHEEVKLEDSFEGWNLIATGLGACPGIVEGPVKIKKSKITSSDTGYILVRRLTEPDDVPYMKPAAGILTASGGVVSHAAVVARSWGKPCVVGCSEVIISSDEKGFSVLDHDKGIQYTVLEDDIVKLDGSTGSLYIKEL